MALFLVWLAILVVAFFFLMVRPQRRRNAQFQTFVAGLEVGEEIITSGGVYGTVVGIDADRVELQVAPTVVITVSKRALLQYATPVPEIEVADADDGTDGDGS